MSQRLTPTVLPTRAAMAGILSDRIRVRSASATTSSAPTTQPAGAPTPQPDRQTLQALAQAAAHRSTQFFASFGLGWSEGVRPVRFNIRTGGVILPIGTSSWPSLWMDGSRTIRLEQHDGRNDAMRADIVAHEFAHGVIDRYVTADTPQGRAVGEALADIFAVAIEDADLDVDGRALATGEGIWRMDQVPAGGYRSDNGGEHAMMGIVTRPAHVFASRFGRREMGRLFVTAMTRHLGSGSHDFVALAAATIKAARQLYGAGSAHEKLLWRAWTESRVDVAAVRSRTS